MSHGPPLTPPFVYDFTTKWLDWNVLNHTCCMKIIVIKCKICLGTLIISAAGQDFSGNGWECDIMGHISPAAVLPVFGTSPSSAHPCSIYSRHFTVRWVVLSKPERLILPLIPAPLLCCWWDFTPWVWCKSHFPPCANKAVFKKLLLSLSLLLTSVPSGLQLSMCSLITSLHFHSITSVPAQQ